MSKLNRTFEISGRTLHNWASLGEEIFHFLESLQSASSPIATKEKDAARYLMRRARSMTTKLLDIMGQEEEETNE